MWELILEQGEEEEEEGRVRDGEGKRQEMEICLEHLLSTKYIILL